MEYVKGKPYFCFCEEKINQYKYLDSDARCDVLISWRKTCLNFSLKLKIEQKSIINFVDALAPLQIT